ncbi:MAG: heme-binding domain-containing protein [Epsilonproteobacteria bacterium]|nr:heme-binding domain-containing protein [Campylobacterota bacterium]
MKKILAILLLLLVVIQFIPYGKDYTNPAVIAEPKWDSLETRALFMKACVDCHTNETKWPAYSNVAPISWIVYNHVIEGREHFNISAWGHQKKNKGDEAAEELEEGEMPLKSYLLAHPEAQLTDDETKLLIQGLKNTFGEEKED